MTDPWALYGDIKELFSTLLMEPAFLESEGLPRQQLCDELHSKVRQIHDGVQSAEGRKLLQECLVELDRTFEFYRTGDEVQGCEHIQIAEEILESATKYD